MRLWIAGPSETTSTVSSTRSATISPICPATGPDAHRPATRSSRPSNIVAAAMIDADGRLADDELDGRTSTRIGPLLRSAAAVGTPAELRDAGCSTDAPRWLARPSVLFDLLVRADARDGTNRSHRYYDLALRLRHVDRRARSRAVTRRVRSRSTRFRTMLLAAFDAAGVPRPGQPRRRRHARSPGSRQPSDTASPDTAGDRPRDDRAGARRAVDRSPPAAATGSHDRRAARRARRPGRARPT